MSDGWPRHIPSDGCAPDCFGCKLASVQFHGIDAGQHRFTDRERERDMLAYKRLRGEGLQPEHVFGTAEIEAQASSRFEIEHNVVMTPEVRREWVPKLEDARAAGALL